MLHAELYHSNPSPCSCSLALAVLEQMKGHLPLAVHLHINASPLP